MGAFTCERRFRRILDGSYVEMDVDWDLGNKSYSEHAIFGRNKQTRALSFWSFTSDGKRSHGAAVAIDDLPPGAVAFEADMPAGRARMVLAPPGPTGVFELSVLAQTRRGWRSVLEQRLSRIS